LRVFVRDWLTDSRARNGFADLPHMYDCDMWKIGAAHRLALGMGGGADLVLRQPRRRRRPQEE
jgi:hypothetical protein